MTHLKELVLPHPLPQRDLSWGVAVSEPSDDTPFTVRVCMFERDWFSATPPKCEGNQFCCQPQLTAKTRCHAALHSPLLVESFSSESWSY